MYVWSLYSSGQLDAPASHKTPQIALDCSLNMWEWIEEQLEDFSSSFVLQQMPKLNKKEQTDWVTDLSLLLVIK